VLQFIVRRLLGSLVVIAAISVITFTLARVVPRDPARLIAGPRATQQAVIELRERLGLAGSLPQQYLRYIANVLSGDFGFSFSTRRQVGQDLKTFLPATAELNLIALLISMVIGIPAGVLSAVKRNTWIDYIGRLVSTLGVALPAFWVALVFQLVGYGMLSVLPIGGRLSQGIESPPTLTGFYTLDSLAAGQLNTFLDALWHLITPAFVLSFGVIAVFLRIMRTSMLDVLGSDYVRTAKAKGLIDRAVILKHALRNALLPVLTITGLQIGLLMGGTFFVESVLQWPGLGLYAANALIAADYNATMGVTLLLTFIYIVANLLVDLSYGFADPRLRVG
jgi:peptide/nickel transport system permease protein